jgi:hypothetical protein
VCPALRRVERTFRTSRPEILPSSTHPATSSEVAAVSFEPPCRNCRFLSSPSPVPGMYVGSNVIGMPVHQSDELERVDEHVADVAH